MSSRREILYIASAPMDGTLDPFLRQHEHSVRMTFASNSEQISATLQMPARWDVILCAEQKYQELLENDLWPSERQPHAALVVLQAENSTISAAEAIRSGAVDALPANDIAHLLAVCERELSLSDLRRQASGNRARVLATIEHIGSRTKLPKNSKQPIPASPSRIKKLMDDGGLLLQFQPIVALKPRQSQRNLFEVLIRLRQESGELMMPDEFLPTAITSGWMPKLDTWIVRKSLATLRQLQQSNAHPSTLFINLAPPTLDDFETMDTICTEIAKAKIEPGSLIIELNRDALVDLDQQKAIKRMADSLNSKQHGLLLEATNINDCSLIETHHQHLHYLKLDSKLIGSYTNKPTAQTEIREFIACAQRHEIGVIALAIENAEFLPHLVELGIDAIQGHCISMPYEELIYPMMQHI